MKNVFSKHFPKTQSTNTFLNHLSKQNFVRVLIETRAITKRFFKTLLKPIPQAHCQNKSKWSKQVTKSPWITMDKKGSCTFPFHNLPPEPKKTSQRSFLCFLTFPLDKIKNWWRLLLNWNICEHKRKTSSQFSHRITELATLLGNISKRGVTLGF